MSSDPGTMRVPAEARAEPRMAETEDVGSGWVLYAGVMIMVAGVMNTIYGIAAIAESSFYVGNTRFVFGDLKTWGWIATCIGVIECSAALGIWARATWARWTGVAIASVNAIAQLLFLPAYPLLTLAIFTLDILVIYGLIVHGGKVKV
jgi:hypothetical protein